MIKLEVGKRYVGGTTIYGPMTPYYFGVRGHGFRDDNGPAAWNLFGVPFNTQYPELTHEYVPGDTAMTRDEIVNSNSLEANLAARRLMSADSLTEPQSPPTPPSSPIRRVSDVVKAAQALCATLDQEWVDKHAGDNIPLAVLFHDLGQAVQDYEE